MRDSVTVRGVGCVDEEVCVLCVGLGDGGLVGQDHLDSDWDVGEVWVLYLESEDVGQGVIEFELALLDKLHNSNSTETL